MTTSRSAAIDDRDDTLWRAVLARDARLDGELLYAVRSTGVYCRPSCPSRRPLRRNVLFFRRLEAAERAGFRPCRRCQPRMHEEAARSRHLGRELELAAEIQRWLRPRAIALPDGWEVAYASRPCGEVGGDHLDLFWRRSGERLVLALGDVSGKGAPAALLLSSLHAALRAQVEAQPDLVPAIAELDRYLGGICPPSRFATLFCSELEPGSGELSFVNAGHPPPLLRRRDGSVEALASSRLPLGPFPDRPTLGRRVRLDPGDLLLIYSDGVSECPDGDGEELGEAALRTLLGAAAGLSAAAVGERLEARLRGHAGERGPADDLSWLVLRRCPENGR